MPRRARPGVAAAAAACILSAPASAQAPIPTPIGVGPRFHPQPTSAAVRGARQVGRFTCGSVGRDVVRAHLELFARGRVVIVPAGIGLAPPFRLEHRSIGRARCSYAVRTAEPTGVIEVDARVRPTVGDLFAVWGRRLSPRGLLTFHGAVRAFVAGRPWHGDPRRIPLARHAQIVLQVGAYIPPHATYLFGPGR